MLTRRRLLATTIVLSFVSCRRHDAIPRLLLVPRQEPVIQGVASLLVSSLSRPARDLVADRIESIADAIEARAHPLALDLEEVDIGGAIQEARPLLLPMITAAVRLGSSHYPLDDTRSVQLVRDCERDARCIPAWGELADPDAARARFGAWPIAHGVIVRADTAERASLVADALREATAQRKSPFALVVVAESLSHAPEAAVRVAKAAARCVRLLKSHPDQASALAPLAGDPTPPKLEGLALRGDEVLVVPKLGVLAERARFRAAIVDRVAAIGAARFVRYRWDE